jgi:hypothetical protein
MCLVSFSDPLLTTDLLTRLSAAAKVSMPKVKNDATSRVRQREMFLETMRLAS